jgi:hypothetical protein
MTALAMIAVGCTGHAHAPQVPLLKKGVQSPPSLSPLVARVTVPSRVLHPGDTVTVHISGCPHGRTNDFGVFFHDHREVAIDRHDQSGLLHPTVHWTSATAGTAVLALPKTTRLGRSLITGVCDTVNAPAEETVQVR